MICLFCSLFFVFFCVFVYVSFSVSVDCVCLIEGESVELMLELDDLIFFGKFDLSLLDVFFEVFGMCQVNCFVMQNGWVQVIICWIVIFLLKQSGYVVILLISFGVSSIQLIRLYVLEVCDCVKSSKLVLVFIDVSVDQEIVYVQVQVIFILCIYYLVLLYDDSSLILLVMNDVKVEQFGEVCIYEKEINGICYGVIEVCYVIFLQKSGILEIFV